MCRQMASMPPAAPAAGPRPHPSAGVFRKSQERNRITTGETLAVRRGLQVQTLAAKIERAPETQLQSAYFVRYQIPAMDVGQLNLSGHIQMRRRTGQLRLQRHGSMHAKPARIHPPQRFLQRAALQFHFQIQPPAFGSRRAAHKKSPELLRGAVGARGGAAEPQFHRAVRGRGHVQIGVVEIEDRLGIAELEIDPSGAHANGRESAGSGRPYSPAEIGNSTGRRRSSPG